MENPSNLTNILRSFRKCGFSLVVPRISDKVELYEWAIKASALAHGYEWDGKDSGDDEISMLLKKVKKTGQFHFDLEVEVNDKTKVIWAYAEELLQNAIAMTNEQVKLSTLNRQAIKE